MTPTTDHLIRTPASLRNGQMPTAYDENWQKYSRFTGGTLTAAQTEWFASQPEYLTYYAGIKVQQADVVPITHSSGVVAQPILNGGGIKFVLPGKDARTVSTADITAAHAEYLARWQGLQAKLASVSAAITASPPTVTKREHVDAAFSPQQKVAS